MEDCPAVAFGRWASCPEMCAAAPGREEDRGRGKVAAGLTHWRSESMRGLEVHMEVRRSEKQNRNATSNDPGDTRETIRRTENPCANKPRNTHVLYSIPVLESV